MSRFPVCMFVLTIGMTTLRHLMRSVVGGVNHSSDKEQTLCDLMVDEEEEGPVDGESRRKAAEGLCGGLWQGSSLIHLNGSPLQDLGAQKRWLPHLLSAKGYMGLVT